MDDEQALLETFQDYLSLTQRIKEGSREGELEDVETLLGERNDCQEKIQDLFKQVNAFSSQELLVEMVQILDTAKDINDQAYDFLQEKKKELAKAFGLLEKGKKLATSYQPPWDFHHEASFFDKRS